MPTKQIKDFDSVTTPDASDKLITQQAAGDVTRKMTVAQAVGAADPKNHATRHISGGADAFTSTQLLEALSKRIRESGGADLLIGAIADLELLGRSGTGIAGVARASQAEAEAGTDNAKWMTSLRTKQAIAANGAWPIGSVFISVVATNPATLLGFGTWTAFAAGRCLVGIDAGQTEFDLVEETGGAKTHTLVTAEMPAHTHNYADRITAGGGEVAVGGSNFGQAPTSSTGGGGAHNNLQPYIVVYMWKRTA